MVGGKRQLGAKKAWRAEDCSHPRELEDFASDIKAPPQKMEWRICKAGAEFIEATFNLGNFRKVKSSALEHYSTVPAASLANSL